MATAWDRAAAGYLETWVPRFAPYHADLLREVELAIGDRVLVVSAGPGTEAIAAARIVDLEGHVRATDASEEMVRLCREEMSLAGFVDRARVTAEVADAADTTGGPWDAILCAFGFWQLDEAARDAALVAWRAALSDRGKIGLLVWGPPEDNPDERLFQCVRELAPEGGRLRAPRALAERETMVGMFERAGLAVVRHAVVRHPIAFPTAHDFVHAMRESCACRRVLEEIGDLKMKEVERAFFDRSGGRDAPIDYAPPATIVIGALRR
jgi:protein-L-isoaspartate O-methyltransferase